MIPKKRRPGKTRTPLKDQGIAALENDQFVDVRYFTTGMTTFCEIKPTEGVETRYAIRTAIGQLLEHRFLRRAPAVTLEIVIGTKPSQEEVDFTKSLGLKLTYFDAKIRTFVCAC